ncbi:hypothetical protein CU633_21365 [Bacillus sp. V3-13]|uniref:UPF0158 family protein n=1 Tax=Bacillus sp. V3-13 TaxID=2053728 RepID=UPI000C78A5A0|nr:UPF0158 family protein [Bacillus sp. V3-13]PLR75380.1 hypothetical protein CU633_21365 [Bacillus sp. V3-13]
MSAKIKLTNIIEGIDIQFDDTYTFLNKETGEVISVSHENFQDAEELDSFENLPEWQQEDLEIAIDVLGNDEKYIELPTKYDINEYRIMEDFCYSVQDKRIQDRLFDAIDGKGAFRRFKNKIHDFGIEDQWYSFRDEELKKIAIEWCQHHDLQYID